MSQFGLRIVYPVWMSIIAEKLQFVTLNLVSKLEMAVRHSLKLITSFSFFYLSPIIRSYRASKYTKVVNSWTVYDGHFEQTDFGGLYMKDIKYWALNKSSGKDVNSREFLDMAMSKTQCNLRIKLRRSELRDQCLMIS